MPLPPAPLIRAAIPEDALCLQVLGMQVFLDTYATEGIRPEIARGVLSAFSLENIDAVLARNDMRVYVADRENHLAGFVQDILKTSHELLDSPSPAKLDRIFVQEPFTGGRVGLDLLNKAESVAREAGATDIWLMCWHANHRALRFYTKHGYKDHGVSYYRMEGEEHENRVLAKSLTARAP